MKSCLSSASTAIRQWPRSASSRWADSGMTLIVGGPSAFRWTSFVFSPGRLWTNRGSVSRISPSINCAKRSSDSPLKTPYSTMWPGTVWTSLNTS